MSIFAKKTLPGGGVSAVLADGRLHLQHGPIDLIIGVTGGDVAAAYGRAEVRFDGILAGLVTELPGLRSVDGGPFKGAIAQGMDAAVAPFRPAFITPMAAVAGAVAEAVLAVLPAEGVTRAYVNNGGDIALYLTLGTQFSVALGLGPHRVLLRHADGVRGIATSGWRGRSWSLGIADAVTVLAKTAAMADAAATMIANAVDLPGHPAVKRMAAQSLQHDSDLGARLVTVDVGLLSGAEAAAALDRGLAYAQTLMARGLIAGAALFLHPEARTLGQLQIAAAPTVEACVG